MKVVWISHSSSMGAGAEMVLWEAVRGLKAKGLDLHVILPETGELEEHLQSIQVPTTIIPYGWWISKNFQPKLHYGLKLAIEKSLPAIQPLKLALKTIKPDLVVSNTLAIGAGAVAAKLSGIPHIWYIHELIGSQGHDIYFDLGTSLSLALMDRLSQRIIVNSQTTFNSFKQHLPEHKLRPVYCAVDIPAPSVRAVTSPPSESAIAFHLIIVSRIAPGKRQEDAVRAVSSLVHQGLDLHLTLVGREDAEYGQFIRGLMREAKVEKHVHFAGFTNDPFSHLAAADLAITCSRGETFGLVTVEAMKSGKAVVGAASGGTIELIKDGWSGLLYRLGDADDLAEKISVLYHDRRRCEEIGRNAYEWAHATFNMETYTHNLTQVFKEAVEGSR